MAHSAYWLLFANRCDQLRLYAPLTYCAATHAPEAKCESALLVNAPCCAPVALAEAVCCDWLLLLVVAVPVVVDPHAANSNAVKGNIGVSRFMYISVVRPKVPILGYH